MAGWRDIGGTFIDFCALDEGTGILHTLKVLTTPADPGQEVMDGIALLQERHGMDPAEVTAFVHGTTVGINTVIQRKGADLLSIRKHVLPGRQLWQECLRERLFLSPAPRAALVVECPAICPRRCSGGSRRISLDGVEETTELIVKLGARPSRSEPT